jgi:hypothetical protein
VALTVSVPLATAFGFGEVMVTVGAGLFAVTVSGALTTAGSLGVVSTTCSTCGPFSPVESQVNVVGQLGAAVAAWHGAGSPYGAPSTLSTVLAVVVSAGSTLPATLIVTSPLTVAEPAGAAIATVGGTAAWATVIGAMRAVAVEAATSRDRVSRRAARKIVPPGGGGWAAPQNTVTDPAFDEVRQGAPLAAEAPEAQR